MSETENAEYLYDNNVQGSDNASGNNDDLSKSELTLRALVSTKEAGVIIGKAGKNVADIRDQTGVKAGVSKAIPGVHERVLSISGTLDGVSKAYSMIGATLIESPSPLGYSFSLSPAPPAGIATIRLLISHLQMGTIIGRQGTKIKSIQETFKVRMVASKEILPQSTERVVEIQGRPDGLKSSIYEIGKSLLEDWERATGTIAYTPQPRQPLNNFNSNRFNNNAPNNTNMLNESSSNTRLASLPKSGSGEIVKEQLPISADMVGCIIGKGGNKIAEIRAASGAKISIAKESHDSTGDRMFTITGTREANQEALKLLFRQLENEKNRRTAAAQQQENEGLPVNENSDEA
jgi:heterogeneous nuclear rnp K-like protein 2